MSLLPAPSLLLKTWSHLTRWALGLVVTAWLVFGAAWSALHWVIVPRIGEFRPYLEAHATELLGVPVHIGAIGSHSNGMVPSFELSNVTIMEPQGRVGLELSRILVALSLRSLWHWEFEQIFIEGPQLDIRRSLDGKITVAGLDLFSANASGSGGLEWLFSQLELAIQGGTVLWTDEQRQAEPVLLEHVNVVVRNRGRHHDLRLDATLPEQWGGALSLRGKFLQPLLSRQHGRWQDWEGQIYADFDRVDLSGLRRYANLGVDLTQGQGVLRAWVDVNQGRIIQTVADVALADVSVVLAANLQPLALQRLQGRLGGRVLEQGFEFFSQSVTFDTTDGLHWPGGNLSVMLTGDAGKMTERGQIKADQIDLAALAQMANRLPLDEANRARVLAHAPKGWLNELQASWQGAPPQKYAVKGRASQLEIAAVASVPGVKGVNVNFDFDEQSGQASFAMSKGSVTLPEIFQDPEIAVDEFQADASWQVQGENLAVQFDKVKFANADAQGEAKIKWQTREVGSSSSRFPGVLDLQATLSRADGKQVHRYLPLEIDQAARDYVRDSVLDGTSSAVSFQVKGDLDQLPLIDPQKGVFKITAQVEGAKLAYLPRSLQDSADLPWPMLTDLHGQLVIDRMQLQVKNAHCNLGETNALKVTQVSAMIADVTHPQVSVDADIKGPMPEMLRLVNGSPVTSMTGNMLSNAVMTGSADYKLKLMLPVDNINKSTVNGTVLLSGNDVQITPDSPKLTHARGTFNFTESAVSLRGVQAGMLGGDVRLDGGLVLATEGPLRNRSVPTTIRATGVASAEGLRQASELGFVTRLARQASGNAAYTATLGWRRGVPLLQVNTNLQGVALNLPAPLSKTAEAILPVRLETALSEEASAALQDRLTLSVGNLVQVVYERDISQQPPRVLRGAMGVGLDSQESAVLPSQGVSANINLKNFNVDAWSDALTQAAGSQTPSLLAGNSPALSYLPTILAVRSDTLTLGGRQFNQLVMGGSRDGPLWRANLNASELNGYVEYRQPGVNANTGSTGRVYARLARLSIAPSVASDVEDLLDTQPTSIPALDIVVDDFELRGKRLGRLEVLAVNRSNQATERSSSTREWRLNKFNMVMPEATFAATGNWAALNDQGASPAQRKPSEHRRTVMNFILDINDSGALLDRLDMKGVVRGGRGKLEGQVAWMGSPLSLDYPSMSGAFTVNVESGQFLKAEPGIAKLLGVLSLQSLPRRLALDFRDVFSDGFAFDFLRGNVSIDKGMALTNNLQMKGVNAAVLMEGRADIAHETQDIKVVVIPEINAGTASLIASVVNPAVGLGTFLAQVFLRRPLMESATQEFHIDGSWMDPKITKVERAEPAPDLSPAQEN